jgi:pyruvate dehydrogenase E1 component beta subunit
MLSAIADGNPVLILDHRQNFRQKGFVPAHPYRLPFGKGVVRRAGRDVTIAAISSMVMDAYRAAEDIAREGIEAEVIDLRTLRPLDEKIILESVAKTGRLVIADNGWKTCGAAAEIAAVAAEKGFRLLRGPVRRVTCPDLPTPAGCTLEEAFYPGAAEIAAAAREIVRDGGAREERGSA